MLVLLRSSLIKNNYNLINKYCYRGYRTNKRVSRIIKHAKVLSVLDTSLLSVRQPPVVVNLEVRYFSYTPIRYNEPLKPSSKVEVSVQALKESNKNEAKREKDVTTAPAKAVIEKKPIIQRIKAEIMHYYHGFRLLFIDMKISYWLIWRILNGNSLSRREYRLLMRTVGDMFRLVPFSVFIIVPFMEFLLPVFIKLFPGMLPSTFQTATEKEDKLKQNLKVKLEMAKFLQQTLDDMSVTHKDHNSQLAKEFTMWFHKVRTSGEKVSNEEILKFSKLFQDEITLDSLSRSQLVALCRVLEVQTLGTNNLLRFQLRMKLRSLAADDKMIQKEGIESLSLWEVQQACRARGMRAYGVTEARLRAQLADWLDLSLNEKVPPSLLLLSRALMLPETIPTEDKLKATISSLPDAIVNQTKAAIGESEGKIDNKVQLEVIMEEARKIKEERQELREEIKQKEQEREVLLDKAPSYDDETGIKKSPIMKPNEEEIREKQILISKDVAAIEDALDAISKGKKVIVEKVEIEELKEQLSDYQEDIQDLEKVTSTSNVDMKESKAARRLYNRVHKMINKMDNMLDELEEKEQEKKKIIQEEVTEIGEKKEELLKIEDIMVAIRQIKNVPDDSRLSQIESILSKIDDDQDGSIKIEDVLKVVEFIGKENVHLSAQQVDELIDLLEKEEIIEVESKIEKALKKEQELKLEEVKDEGDGSVERKEELNAKDSQSTTPLVDPPTSTSTPTTGGGDIPPHTSPTTPVPPPTTTTTPPPPPPHQPLNSIDPKKKQL